MEISPLLGPVVALVAWTLVMLVWLAAVRGKAVRKARIDIMASKGGRGQNLEGVLPDEANWPAHNYAHLLEQPTLFYAIVLTLVAMGDTIAINLWLAWGYVGLRVLHSIVQTTINRVAIRFPIFALSTLCLVGLTVHAGARLLHG